jgi:hypothetical protein
MAINIRFGDYTGQDSLRSERQVTVTGDREERRSDLQRIIDDYPAVEAEHRPLKLDFDLDAIRSFTPLTIEAHHYELHIDPVALTAALNTARFLDQKIELPHYNFKFPFDDD